MTPSLATLMDRYVDGDRRAFERLHDHLSPRLRGFLTKLLSRSGSRPGGVRDEPTVDDLLQLTFLKAHLARERFVVPPPPGDPDGAVQGWYFAIARNVALDALRSGARQTRRRVDTEVDAADPTATLDDQIAEHEGESETVARVREAIAALPDSQREVVELHKLRGMSMAEVAARLRVREGAVESVQGASRCSLREPRRFAPAWPPRRAVDDGLASRSHHPCQPVRVRAHRGYKALTRLLAGGPRDDG